MMLTAGGCAWLGACAEVVRALVVRTRVANGRHSCTERSTMLARSGMIADAANRPATSSGQPGRPTREERAYAPAQALSEVLFLLWGYPELTQTFIHRELSHLVSLGAEVRLVGAYRVPRTELDPTTAMLADRAAYLGSPAEVCARASTWAARHPHRFSSVLRWSLGLPHRTSVHRVRMGAMVVAAAAMVEHVEQSGCRYLHAHFGAYQTEWAMCLSRLTGLPYGFTAHATDIWRDANILAEKIRGARLVLTCTEYNRRHLCAQAPEAGDRVHLVRHGIDLVSVGPAPRLAHLAVPQWVAIGRLVEKKGFAHLVQAAAILKARGHRTRIRIVGGGPLEPTLRAQIERLGLQTEVELEGKASNAQVLAVLAGSTGLVVPSVRAANGDLDGIPNVVLEAASLGRPVIASALSGIPEALLPEETGLLVPPGDARALADAMEALGTHHPRAAEFGQRGRALMERDFDLAKNVQLQCELLARARYSSEPVTSPSSGLVTRSRRDTTADAA